MKALKRIVALMIMFILIASTGIAYSKTNDKKPLNHIREKIMAKDSVNNVLELELRGNVQLAENCRVYQTTGDSVVQKSLSDVMVGAENVNLYYTKDGLVDLIILDGPTPINTMRVGIMNSGFSSLDHDKLEIKSLDGFRLIDKKEGKNFDISPDTLVTFVNENNKVKVYVNGEVIYETSNRLYALPVNEDSKIQIMTFKRGYGYPSYRGFFEITKSPVEGKLRLINEVDFEKYLYQVVPSEMPASFGLNALKAQAVAARTYALGDYYANRFAKEGFHIVDSTLSQVYNNSAENQLTTQAVDDTKGIIMRSGGELVDARYYSTSGGYGASKHEVWSDYDTNKFPGTPVPYLRARSYTYDPSDNSRILNINVNDEQEIAAFYKNLSLTGYDSASYYFRWRIKLTKEEIQNTINKNILLRYSADPNFVLTKNDQGDYVSKPIPAEGIGEFKNMYVAKRGKGGNIMELVIEGTTGTYKIIKEYNIRFTIRPNKTDTKSTNDIYANRAMGGSTDYAIGYDVKNPSILFSAFFTFDITKDSEGNVSAVTFYGGGNGHGVGMSQYGASMLGQNGWTFDKILSAYYSDIDLVNFYEENQYNNTDAFKLLVTTFTALHREAENGEASKEYIPGQWINKYMGSEK